MHKVLIALVSLSSAVSLGDLSKMALATEAIANERFCPAWGIAGVECHVVTDPSKVPDGAIVATFVDSDAGDGTEAFHDEANGAPYIEVDVSAILDLGGSVLDDKGTGLSVLDAFTHEVWETLVDMYVSDWISLPNGTSFLAKETADPVETSTVPVTLPCGTTLNVSNAVLPRYFDAQAPSGGRLDLAGVVTAPFENLGYQIVFDATKLDSKDGPISDVFAMKAYKRAKLEWRKARNRKKTGRYAARAATFKRAVPPKVTTAPKTKPCGRCGAQNQESATFCFACKAPFASKVSKLPTKTPKSVPPKSAPR